MRTYDAKSTEKADIYFLDLTVLTFGVKIQSSVKQNRRLTISCNFFPHAATYTQYHFFVYSRASDIETSTRALLRCRECNSLANFYLRSIYKPLRERRDPVDEKTFTETDTITGITRRNQFIGTF